MGKSTTAKSEIRARSFFMNPGSQLSLNVSTRCGWSPCACQMRCVMVGLRASALAIVRTLQCVASGGVVCKVRPIRLSDASGTDRHGHVEEAGPVHAARRIGNGFPPPPLFLHEPGRFEGTRADTSRFDGCRQALGVERVRPQTTCRQSVTETRSNGFDSGASTTVRGVFPLYQRRLR